MSDVTLKEYKVEVDSKIVGLEPHDDQRLTEALASAGAQLVRLDRPRFTVRVTASSGSEAERQAVQALERWVSGPGAGWHVVGHSDWEDS